VRFGEEEGQEEFEKAVEHLFPGTIEIGHGTSAGPAATGSSSLVFAPGHDNSYDTSGNALSPGIRWARGREKNCCTRRDRSRQ
jgi:hypothetical protein